MGFWKISSSNTDIERHYYYLSEKDFANGKYAMSMNCVDLLGRNLYVVNASLGLFEEAHHQFWTTTYGQARKIAEKWFVETYTKHVEDLENDLLYSREELRKITEEKGA